MLSMNVPVDEFITPDPVTAREDMSIDEVRSLMDRHDIRHLPPESARHSGQYRPAIPPTGQRKLIRPCRV